MIFLNILLIVSRIFCGLCVVGFVLGMFLYKKYKIFNDIFGYICFGAMFYGVGRMFIFAVLGIS